MRLADVFLRYALGFKKTDAIALCVDRGFADVDNSAVFGDYRQAVSAVERANRALGLKREPMGGWMVDFDGSGNVIHPYEVHTPDSLFRRMRQDGLGTLQIFEACFSRSAFRFSPAEYRGTDPALDWSGSKGNKPRSAVQLAARML